MNSRAQNATNAYRFTEIERKIANNNGIESMESSQKNENV